MEDFLDIMEGQPCLERGTLDTEAETWGQPDMSAYTDENDFHDFSKREHNGIGKLKRSNLNVLKFRAASSKSIHHRSKVKNVKLAVEETIVRRTTVEMTVDLDVLIWWFERPRVGQALLQQLVTSREYTNYLLSAEDRIRVEDTTEGRKHNRNKSKSWKIREIKYRQNITYSNCNQKGHFQNQCLMLVASRDKEVNMARDSDDALVCCVENTVEDRIMDSGALFHATYHKEELERFKLRFVKVRLAYDKTLDIAGVGDVVLKTSFGTSCTLKDVRYIPGLKRRLISVGQLDEEGYHVGFRDQQWKVTKGSLVVAHRNNRESLIGMSMLASKGNVPDVRKVDIYFCKPGGLGKQKKLSFIMSVKTRKVQRAESTGICVEVLKMLWADSVSTTYLIYRIPYVSIRLRILEEEWRGKDTSLAHLKVFGCDSFVKVKDVCGEAMKCTFIGSGSDEVRYSFRDTKSHQVIRSRDITFMDSIYGARSVIDSSSLTKPIQKSQVVLVDIPENLTKNVSIVSEHGLSSEITQSLGGSSDTSEGSENSRSFKDNGRSDEEYSKTPQNGEPESYSEALSSKESVQWKKAIIEEMVSLEKNQTCSLVRLPAGKKASQILWMFRVLEEQDDRKSCRSLL
ncbi:retrovirus-related pol polyprotein from transposon TNT 1-94, partial [Tanacetum coccineum]